MATVWAFYALGLLCLLPQAAFAAGAFAVDDAEIVDPDKIQVENWYSHSSNDENLGVIDAAYQILPNAELTLQNEYDASRGGRSDEIFGQIKYQWREVDEDDVASSVVFGFNHFALDNRFAGLYAYVPSTWAVSKSVYINTNLGWEYDDQQARHYLTWGIGTELHADDAVSLVIEGFGKNSVLPGLQIGPRWNVSDTVELDVIYGRNITNIPANWITAGTTVTF